MNDVLQRANRFLMPNYGVLGLEIYQGKGTTVWTRDADGNEAGCLDLLCGLGVNSLGHCHPKVTKAIHEQTDILGHVSNLYATSPMVVLAEKLRRLFSDSEAGVFFCNSGTEANEAAMKLARIWGTKNFGPEKQEIVALVNSFHGRTMWSISVTGQSKMQELFGAPIPGIKFVPLNDVNALRRAATKNVCAVIFETIQAEGGVHPMSPEFYSEMMTLSDEHHFLTIADEVQTGIGRTGKMFAYEKFFRHPDIVTLAKALGGGLPIGAVLARKEVSNYLLQGSHAATFGGNPIVCSAGNAVLEVIEKDNLLERVSKLGNYLSGVLQNMGNHYDKVVEVRGAGCLWGIELTEPRAGEVVKRMREMGVIIGTAGANVVRIMPPFIIKTDELLDALGKLFQVLGTL